MNGDSSNHLKPYFQSKYITNLRECIISNLGDTSLTKDNFHTLKKIFFDTFSSEEFLYFYKKLAIQVSESFYGMPENSCLQVTPTPRISYGGSHGTSIHTDYWYGHGKSAITVWVPILNCVPGSTFYSDDENELGFDHDVKDFSISILNEITNKISKKKFQVLPPENSCYVFNSQVLHGSPLNTTSKTRLSFDFRISKKDDPTSAKDLNNYFQYDDEQNDYLHQKHPFYEKSVLKYVSNGYGKNSFIENITINETAEKYGFLISDQEGEIMRFGNPVFEAILDGHKLSNKYSGIVVFSKTIFPEKIIEKIKLSNIKVWACLENKFI